MSILTLRREYHNRIGNEIIRLQTDGETTHLNFADKGSKASRAIAQGIVDRLGIVIGRQNLSGQTVGEIFEVATVDFLERAFTLLQHLRPGQWIYSSRLSLSDFDQYAHLAELAKIVKQEHELASVLGTDYIITPDIIVGRYPVSDDEINQRQVIVTLDEDQLDMLQTLIEGRRLRDISDLPFDLAV